MTAEIAVMNRRAVAFAADSAMTISSAGKTYNSADKIFEMSVANSIGLMLYNSLDYMGMPLDILIKEFREQQKNRPFDTLEQMPEEFFSFILAEFKILDESEDLHVDNLIGVVFEHIKTHFFRRVISTAPGAANVYMMFIDTVRDAIGILEKIADSECYWDLAIEDFIARYSHVFDSTINDVFSDLPPLNDDDMALLKYLAALSLKKAYFSMLHTGFVFAGFGQTELFPQLRSFQFDGMIMGRLKRIQRQTVTIDASNARAKIVPFAQHGMVDRFLVGIDERHEQTIINNVRQNLADLSDSILKALPGIHRNTRERLRTNLKTSAETIGNYQVDVA